MFRGIRVRFTIHILFRLKVSFVSEGSVATHWDVAIFCYIFVAVLYIIAHYSYNWDTNLITLARACYLCILIVMSCSDFQDKRNHIADASFISYHMVIFVDGIPLHIFCIYQFYDLETSKLHLKISRLQKKISDYATNW